MLKILNKNLYWSMIDENNCIGNPLKLEEFFEKTKNARYIFDNILNYLFNINDETINYLLVENDSKMKDLFPVRIEKKNNRIKKYCPINNSYFIGITKQTCKHVDLKKNNVVIFTTNITSSSKIEVYLSETELSKYYYKVQKTVPVVVLNVPEYAQEKIYLLFYHAFNMLFQQAKCKTPSYYTTNKPIVNANKRKEIICNYYNLSEDTYNKWINGEPF